MKKILKSNGNPDKCPKCGEKVVSIVYGLPMGELFEKAERGEVVLGGCCIAVDENGRIMMPEWACVGCGCEFKR